MKVLKFRHFGVPVQDIEEEVELMERLGFAQYDWGEEVINGNPVKWVKFTNSQGVCIELIQGGYFHMAFTVDGVQSDEKHYHMVAPSGCKVQYHMGPGGIPCEMVEEPKKEGSEK